MMARIGSRIASFFFFPSLHPFRRASLAGFWPIDAEEDRKGPARLVPDSIGIVAMKKYSLIHSSWSPYAAGAGIGVLSWLVFLLVDKPLGMSTEVSKMSGWLVGLFSGMDTVRENAYWASTTPAFGYSTIFLISTALGALASSLVTKTFAWEYVPKVWKETYGGSVMKRMLASFVGGAILLFGARLAGGCTSGHGISGTLQLALSGWIFFPVMFVSGIATASLLFRHRN
jgi:uncharacterized membrane protein YedE/YeeE